jgi:chemotaxis protein methyltransferase CheR
MSALDCIQFLQWSLPKLRMRWPGFRKVRGQVCSLKDLPLDWLEHAFSRQDGRYCIGKKHREKVHLLAQDIRRDTTAGTFHLILFLCRNLVFTYFDEGLQSEILRRLRDKFMPGGSLVIGVHEALPSGCQDFEPWPGSPCVYRRI